MGKMIKTIKKSDLDTQKLSEIDIRIDDRLDNFDFSGVVVNKPWGYEYLTYSNDMSALWILHIKKDFGTSMHCHLDKRTTLILLSGEAKTTTLNEEYVLKPGDLIILDKKVFHTTLALSDKGIILLEIETPPRKTDLVRLKDEYGRRLKGYELQNEMCFEPEKYMAKFLSRDLNRKIGDIEMCVKNFEDEDSLKESAGDSPFVIILEGILINKEKRSLLISGDIVLKEDLENNNIKIEVPGQILKIFKRT